jgi:hypothetical protein
MKLLMPLYAVCLIGSAFEPPKLPVPSGPYGIGRSAFYLVDTNRELMVYLWYPTAQKQAEATGTYFPNAKRLDGIPEVQTALHREFKMIWPLLLSGTVFSHAVENAARFVLTRLTELKPLGGKLDTVNVAAMGHSLGAEFAARACQLDARFKACVDLDGAMVPVAALPIYPDEANLKQPLLYLEAFHPANQMAAKPDQVAEFYKKKEEQLQACPRGSYDIVLNSPGIAHPSFSDVPLLFAGTNGYPETSVVLNNLELIETYVRAFLDRNLKHRKAPVLDAPVSEAAIQRYGH